jgi:hypothetical protein
VRTIDFERLFKLRLVVARHGEMDGARWWNTQGILGRRGALVLKRGFPTTHYFAQARIAFAVATSRCVELFSPPGCMTLWSLPAEIEDQFEDQWQSWLDQGDKWSSVFQTIASQNGNDILKSFSELELISNKQLEAVGRLKRSAENRAVLLSGAYQPSDDVITLLAAGFARGEPGAPAIPYARLGEA